MVTNINAHTERHRHMLRITYKDLRALIFKCHIINGWLRCSSTRTHGSILYPWKWDHQTPWDSYCDAIGGTQPTKGIETEFSKAPDLTIDFQGIQGIEEIIKQCYEDQSAKSRMGAFYGTSYFISSTNKQHGKTNKEVLSQIKGDLRDIISQMQHVDLVWLLIQSN